MSEAAQAAPAVRCPCCGHLGPGDGVCARCNGDAKALSDTPAPLPSGRGLAPIALLAGIAGVGKAAVQVLHHRAFVGLLKLPIAANVVAFATFALTLWLLLRPWFAAWFAIAWPVLDGVRQYHASDGPWALLLATAWYLWPVWFDVIAGAAVAPMIAKAEIVIGGPGMTGVPREGFGSTLLRLRHRARLLALQLATLPVLWCIVLAPVAGVPLVLLITAIAPVLVFCEVPATRRGLDRATHFADLRRNWARALGYGIGCQLALLVPFLNLLVLAPAAAVGATVLHFRFDKQNGPAAAGNPPAG